MPASRRRAEVVGCAQFLRGRRESEFRRGGCELAIERAGRLRDLRHIPFQQLRHRSDGGREQREVRTFAHIETARTLVVTLGVEDQAREIAGVGALNPVFFERLSTVPLGRDIEKAGTCTGPSAICSWRRRRNRAAHRAHPMLKGSAPSDCVRSRTRAAPSLRHAWPIRTRSRRPPLVHCTCGSAAMATSAVR